MTTPSDLGERVIASLEEFRDDLRRGERIIVKTIEQCGCDSNPLSRKQNQCHICGGRGFVIDGKTLLPRSKVEMEGEA